MKTVFRRFGKSLMPADEQAAEWLAKVPNGDCVMLEGRRPRNIGHHRKLFALLRIVVANQEHFKSEEHLLDALKVMTGHVKEYSSLNGDVRYVVPKSISFESMGQEEFSLLYDKMVDVIIAKIVPGLNKFDLEKEVQSLIAPPEYHR